ncbi:Cyclic-di-AMP phosphodiesterase PgpH [Pontiella desulfatans]|uniref:Cyclic-di-AMP phosphodiesterase PgpH n=1 Tax=Pontiella desulfatans TaxID=2750659 RepID=A0A6C2UB50_PONDE|nr:HDIG domain-containing metalloprotein [Pontiella desulfatans]VGO16584.1 Cyclic-di-AMP phosphodiesterase PgpH [Pontiella desulfatans]
MKTKKSKKRQKGIAERKTEVSRKKDVPYKSVGLGILLWLMVTWLFFGHGIVRTPTLSKGQKVPSTITASVDFECENLSDTDLARTRAAAAVPPVFTIDPAPAQDALKIMGELFNRLGAYTAASTNDQPSIASSMDDLLINSPVDALSLIAAVPSNAVAETKAILTKGIQQVMKTGILPDEYRITLFSNDPEHRLTISTDADPAGKTVNQKNLYSAHQAVRAITSTIEEEPRRELLDRMLPMVVVDNLEYDKDATVAAGRLEASKVEASLQLYPAGTIIARAGDEVNDQILLLIKFHEEQRIADQDALEQALEILGNGILLLAGLICTAVILRVGNATLVREPEKLLLMVLLSLATLGMARLLTYLASHFDPIAPMMVYLVPHALAILLTGILLGGSAAICLGFWCSFATAVLFDQAFDVFALGMIITVTAASSARNIHRRSSLFRAGLWVCAVKTLYVLIIAILNQPDLATLGWQVAAAISSGMIATILTMLLIPVFEKAFKITTDITLLELSDMGHPLLQKMAMQAPGTYHHSLMVATLAQNAAEAIGANSLLTRVCAYYHDIGKMAKPEFFTENIQHKENPHDELSPHMSALVISSHVKEGLTLAKRHKLPQPVMDAIEQHHGNGLISFFYHKAKTMAKAGAGGSMNDVINDSDFRYGGAPAVSPEMAILSLADASEAASRSIEKPTPQKISNMMDDIFAAKIRDGQMDYANLTMAEINVVKQSFIFSLSNMLHGRIPYPKDNDNNLTKPTAKPYPSAVAAPKAS